VTSGALELTDGGGYEARAVWYATPVNVQNFTTDFNFQITPGVSAIAGGFTFAIQNVGVNAIGADDGELGYRGIGSSVAIKFDLFQNSG
jgi:Bacterial lectin